MNKIDTALFAASSAVFLLGIAGGWVKSRLWLSEQLVCLIVGALIGPAAFGFVDEATLPGPLLVKALAHLTLGIVVMEAALRLPQGYFRRNWRPLAVALCVALPLSWATASALAWSILGHPILPALLLGALLAPTDPVLASSVVEGGRAEDVLPARTREFLISESGANDGLGQLMLLLPALLIESQPGQALRDWLLTGILWDTVLAILIGLTLGHGAGRLMVWARGRESRDSPSTATLGLALSVAVLAAIQLAGSGSILAVFAAGLAFARYTREEDTLHARVQASIGRFFTLPFFLVLGTLLPWHEWLALGLPGLAFAFFAATFRRIPWWYLLRRSMAPVETRREAIFLGFFGPIGTATIYYALLVHDWSGQQFWPIASLAVTVSATVHGLATSPALRLFGIRKGTPDSSP